MNCYDAVGKARYSGTYYSCDLWYQTAAYCLFTALIISCVVYALTSCGGYLSSHLLDKIHSMLRKAHKFGYTVYNRVVNATDVLQKW